MLAKPMTAMLCMLAIGALAIGCGDDDDGNASGQSVSTSSLTKQQFVKRAVDICKAGREDVTERVTAYQEKNPPGDESAAAYRAKGVQEVLLPMLEAEIDALRELGAPRGDEERIEAMLVAQQQGIDEVADLQSLDPTEGVMESYFEPARRAMSTYGLEECAVK